MLGNLYISNLPVYRLDQDSYNSELDRFVSDEMEGKGRGITPKVRKLLQESVSGFYSRNPCQKVLAEENLFDIFGGAWLFNEIIGYVRLFLFEGKISSELWWQKSLRIRKTRNKLIYYRNDVDFGSWEFDVDSSSEELSKMIRGYTNHLKKTLVLKRYHLDDSIFSVICSHLDWKKLVSIAGRSPGRSPRGRPGNSRR